jgi:hypothetical protein
VSDTAAPLPVTDEDKLAAWEAFYSHADYPAIPYDEKDWSSREIMAGIERALIADRKRAVDRQGGAHAA